MSMSTPRSIFIHVTYFSFLVSFLLSLITTLFKQTYLFFLHFLEFLSLFLDDDVMKKVIAIVQSQGVT